MNKYAYSLTILRSYDLTVLKSYGLTVLRSYGLKILRSYSLSLLLFCLSFLFVACEQHTDIPETPENPEFPLTGERIPIHFTVSDNAFADADENPIELHAGTIVPLRENTIVRIVAYIALANDTVYTDHADYEVTNTGTLNLHPLSTSLTVFPGFTYKFVAYSFDSTGPFSPTYDPIIDVNPPNDLMWGAIVEPITPTHTTIHITMNHLVSKVTLVVTALPTGIISNTIDAITNATIHADLPELDVQTGVVIMANPTPGSGRPGFTWTAGSASTKTSNPLLIYPPTGQNYTTLNFDAFEINGIVYTGPYTVIYDKPLVPGTEYTLQVNLHFAHGGSADRITLELGSSPRLAITRDPNDFGLFFKFGGVVGMNSSDVNFSTSTIVYNPLGPSVTPITGYGTDVLPGVPGYTSSDANIHSISSNDYHNLANVQQGKGDPCRLIGMYVYEIHQFADDAALYAREEALKAQGIGGWRLPTVLDNQRFIDLDPIPANYTLHFWGNASGGVIPSPFGNPAVDGAEFPYRNSLNGAPNPDKFLPATGRRDTNGSLIYAKQSGYYWSDIPEYGSFARTALYFANGGVINSTSSDQYYASAVRCVREFSGITLTVEDWVPGGTLGTGGEGDIVLP